MRLVEFGKRWRYAAALAALPVVLGMASAPDAALAQGNQGPTTTADDHRRGPGFDERTEVVNYEVHTHVNVCSKLVGAGEAHCDARVRIDAKARSSQPARADQARPAATIGNNGAYDPGFLQSAYNVMGLVQANAGAGQVVAIVDAYDDPNAQSDVSYYRSYFGLPALPACTTWPSSTACFRKIDQNGGTSYPAADQGWAEEISLDLDMVSAMCPSCSILLVEANSAAYTDLGTGVNKAVSL